jgi:5'-3' exonuclease
VYLFLYYRILKLVKFLVYPVIEEDETSMEAADGTVVKVPVNMASPNPNNTEFDNLYLDMNGIVCGILVVLYLIE